MNRREELHRAFQGVVPAIIATCARDGTPNVTYLSQVFAVDDRHVALSRQFFNKTSQNVAENPYAAVQVLDPLGFAAFELDLRFVRSETEGPLFDSMATRIQAIASHAGMQDVFKLIAADVYEIEAERVVSGFLTEEPVREPSAPVVEAPSLRTELGALQAITAGLGREGDLEQLLVELLAALEAQMGFRHSKILLADETGERLYTIASRGYQGEGVGAEVAIGEGLIGTVAQRRTILSLAGIDADMRYGRAVRDEIRTSGGSGLRAEIPLPGLSDARSHLAIPLQARGRLVGVLAVESRDPLEFQSWHKAFLEIVANQAAIAIENAMLREDPDGPQEHAPAPPARPHATSRSFCLYKNDDCVFVDGDYLIRNVPARILWKILRAYRDGHRVEFTNRELRLDPTLGLPAIKDNLESRLILLRKRLADKCPDVRLVSTGRGRFRLELDCAITLVEREQA